MTDPVPPTARIELGRLSGRWHQLPLGQALPHVGAVRALAQRYADRAASRTGSPSRALPELGPAVVMDQLAVTVYDLSLLDADPCGPARERPGGVPELAEELAALRRRLG